MSNTGVNALHSGRTKYKINNIIVHAARGAAGTQTQHSFVILENVLRR